MTTALHCVPLALWVTSPGQVMVQPPPPVLLTVTLKLQLWGGLFNASVAVQLTVVVPTGNKEPDAGTQVTVAHGPVVVGAG